MMYLRNFYQKNNLRMKFKYVQYNIILSFFFYFIIYIYIYIYILDNICDMFKQFKQAIGRWHLIKVAGIHKIIASILNWIVIKRKSETFIFTFTISFFLSFLSDSGDYSLCFCWVLSHRFLLISSCLHVDALLNALDLSRMR